MLKVGIVGFGYSAQTFHLPFLTSLASSEDIQICAVSSSDAEKVRGLLPDVTVVNDHRQLCAMADLDLVIITSPNDTHADLASIALQSGSHVVVEKPITTKLSDAIALQAEAKQQGKLIVPFHNRRWDGDFMTLKNLIKHNTLGPIHYFESHFDRFRPQPRDRWRENGGEGSGIFWDLAPHLLDQALQLFGKPQQLTATLRILRPKGKATDYFNLQLHYGDKQVVLSASPYMAAENPRFVAQGEHATYIKQGLDGQEEGLKNGANPLQAEFGQEAAHLWGRLHTAEGSSAIPTLQGEYLDFYRQLLDALRHQAPVPVAMADGVEVIRLITLAEQSAAEGRRVSC
jgi:predicted dehydrogenase